MLAYTASVKQRGIRQGVQEGENKLSKLIQLLIAAGRMTLRRQPLTRMPEKSFTANLELPTN